MTPREPASPAEKAKAQFAAIFARPEAAIAKPAEAAAARSEEVVRRPPGATRQPVRDGWRRARPGRAGTHRRAALSLLPLLAGLLILPPEAVGAERASTAVLVKWASGESVERISRSAHKQDFFPLSNHFISQDNKIFCGPVSSAIVLNALRLEKGRLDKGKGLPQDSQSIAEHERAWLPKGFNPFYGKYTPNNVLTDRTKTRLEVLGKPIDIGGKPTRDFGLQLRQLAQVLRSHGLEVTIRVVDAAADASAIRQEIARNLAARNDYVLVNYSRRALGQKGGGHISPLGAYDEASDSFLVMDVNPNSAPWVWVGADDLVAAMRTFDTVENRGYLLISEAE